jgi:foldase protein PrsA
LKRSAISLPLIALVALLVLSACDEQRPTVQTPAVQSSGFATPTANSAGEPTAMPQSAPQPTNTLVVAGPKPGGAACPPNSPLPANAQLAARVNGVGISLDLYNRQVAQAQAAMVSQGLDPNSAAGKEALKSLKQQVLDQLINDVAIGMQADKEGVKFSDNDINARLAQMVSDAGSVDKLNEYLSKNQMSLGDLCSQLRSQIAGEAMLSRVTSTLPTSVEQVHARHILVSTAALAQAILTQIRQGKDFASLAKQYSIDEASKSNGGDLGWFPKGVMEPQFEAIAFQLRPGQVSEVVQTQFGYHIIKVEERDSSRPLPPELIQNARQQAFLAWLQAVRDTMKIERLVQP